MIKDRFLQIVILNKIVYAKSLRCHILINNTKSV